MTAIQKISARVRAAERPDRAVIVFITGVDTAGKSEFTTRLAASLATGGSTVAVVHVDDFHRPRSERYSADENPAVSYFTRSIDFERLRQVVLDPASRGIAIDEELVLLDVDSDTYCLRRLQVPAHGILLVEGVFLFRDETAAYRDLAIYLSVSTEQVYERARMRDVPKQGSHVLAKYRNKYLPAQVTYEAQARPRERSDIVVNNDDWRQPQEFLLEPRSLLAEKSVLLFDFWDTLVPLSPGVSSAALQEVQAMVGDSSGAFVARWRETRVEREQTSLRSYLGWILPQFGVSSHDLEEVSSRIIEIRRHHFGTAVFAALDPVLKSLRDLRDHGCRIGIVSNCTSEVAALIRSSGLAEVVSASILSCEVGVLKPDAKIFRTALVACDARASEAVFVGDGLNLELEGARRVGIDAIQLFTDGAPSHGWMGPRVERLDEIVRRVTSST